MKSILRRIPLLHSWTVRLKRLFPAKKNKRAFAGSAKYWDNRYKAGGNSGKGSYEKLATFKAEILNEFVRCHAIADVIEFGCGDGNQLALANYPAYVGFDVSPVAIQLCRQRFGDDATKRFELLERYHGEQCDLSMSLDVIYHLVEDKSFDDHMRMLFDAGRRYVVIYSNNVDVPPTIAAPHVRYRKFSDWIAVNRPGWKLLEHVPNRHPYNPATGEGSPADFFVYDRPHP